MNNGTVEASTVTKPVSVLIHKLPRSQKSFGEQEIGNLFIFNFPWDFLGILF